MRHKKMELFNTFDTFDASFKADVWPWKVDQSRKDQGKAIDRVTTHNGDNALKLGDEKGCIQVFTATQQALVHEDHADGDEPVE